MINDELISRKEVIDRLQKAQNVFLKASPLEACGISYAREIIASEVEIPTIEKRPTGEWIESCKISSSEFFRNKENFIESKCSNCNRWSLRLDFQIEEEFCPFCGAKMKGDKENETIDLSGFKER